MISGKCKWIKWEITSDKCEVKNCIYEIVILQQFKLVFLHELNVILNQDDGKITFLLLHS